MTQACFSGQAWGESRAEPSEGSVLEAVEGRMEDKDFRAGGLLSWISLSEASLSEPALAVSCCCCFLSPLFAKSKAEPGVFGVFAALPKLAKAPLPKPKAEEAPVLVGDATEVVLKGAEKGLLFP